MTPTNTQGSEQSLEDKIIAERWSVPVGADDSVDVITVDRVLALIKPDTEDHWYAGKKANESYEYLYYCKCGLSHIDMAVITSHITWKLAQLSKEDSNHA